jgi:hypothetical protein
MMERACVHGEIGFEYDDEPRVKGERHTLNDLSRSTGRTKVANPTGHDPLTCPVVVRCVMEFSG